MNNTVEEILTLKKLRHTHCRLATLNQFVEYKNALSFSDLEKTMSPEYDRVTVYRTIRTFLEKGLIHKVLDDTGNMKYALCAESCTNEQHNHQHIHFKCEICGSTNCLTDVYIPLIQLPKGYLVKETNILVQGICPLCNPQTL